MVQLEEVRKTYRRGRDPVQALDRVSLRIEKGEFIIVRGPSGSGKTTLLMTMAALLRPTSGAISVDGRDVLRMSAGERARFRAKTIGYIFQMFHLVPYLNVIENVVFAAGAAGTNSSARARAEELLDQLGLHGRSRNRPSELSAGEKQRTAIARALLNRPRLLLADEPTGNLDPENARAVMEHLAAFHRDGGTVVVATHDTTGTRFADRVVTLAAGRIQEIRGANGGT